MLGYARSCIAKVARSPSPICQNTSHHFNNHEKQCQYQCYDKLPLHLQKDSEAQAHAWHSCNMKNSFYMGVATEDRSLTRLTEENASCSPLSFGSAREQEAVTAIPASTSKSLAAGFSSRPHN